MQQRAYEDRFGVIVVAGRRTVIITELSRSQLDREFRVEVDDVSLGSIRLPVWWTPRLTIEGPHILVYGGTSLYIGSLDGEPLTSLELEIDDIHAVYPCNGSWIIVEEIGVSIFTPSENGITARYKHNEVIMKSWLSDGELVFEDFGHRRIELSLPGLQTRVEGTRQG